MKRYDNMKSKILIEQRVDWDELEKEVLTRPIDTLKPDVIKKPVVVKPPVVTDPDDETKIPKPEDKTVKEDSLIKYKSKLISNAILFYEQISKATRFRNWDEDKIKAVMKTYVFERRVGDPSQQALYIYMLYRILNPSFNTQRTKYKTQYNYWINRNLTVATTIDMLIAEKNPYIVNFIDWFRGKPFDWTDWELKELNWYFVDSIFKSPVNTKQLYDNPQSSKLSLKLMRSDDKIHSMIIDMYNKQVFGKPGGARKNVVIPGSKSKQK